MAWGTPTSFITSLTTSRIGWDEDPLILRLPGPKESSESSVSFVSSEEPTGLRNVVGGPTYLGSGYGVG